MVYSFQLAARVLSYASSNIQDNTYHSLCYTSHGALGGMWNSYRPMIQILALCPVSLRSVLLSVSPFFIHKISSDFLLLKLSETQLHGRASAYGVLGCQIYPSWWTHSAIDWSNKGHGMFYPVLWDGAYKRSHATNWKK